MNRKGEGGLSLVRDLVIAGIAISVLVAILFSVISLLSPNKIPVRSERNFDNLVNTINELKKGETKTLNLQLDEYYSVTFLRNGANGKLSFISNPDSNLEWWNNMFGYYNEQTVELKNTNCKDSAEIALYKIDDKRDFQRSFESPLKYVCLKGINLVMIENYADFEDIYESEGVYVYLEEAIHRLEIQKLGKDYIRIKILN